MTRRPHSRRARVLVFATALVVAASVGLAWRATHQPADAATTTTQTVTASLQTLQTTVGTSGTIEPATQSTLSFTSSGTVTSVTAAPGDKVVKGQRLATMESTSLTNAVTLAQANLTAAQATLADTQSAGGTATAIAAARAQVTVAASSVADAKTALADATMISPITGIVAAVNISVGDQVGTGSSGASGSGGTGGAGGGGTSGSTASSSSAGDIVVITNTSWTVSASVGSADLASMKKGLQAVITPTGSSTAVFGTIQSVGVVATTSSSGSATFPVAIKVTGSPSGLYAGGTADVEIVVKQVTNAVTIPTAAILTENGQTVVHQVKGTEVVTTPVTIGVVSGATTQITQGLSSGDIVQEQTVSSASNGSSGSTRGGNFGGGFGGGGFGGGGFGGRPGG